MGKHSKSGSPIFNGDLVGIRQRGAKGLDLVISFQDHLIRTSLPMGSVVDKPKEKSGIWNIDALELKKEITNYQSGVDKANHSFFLEKAHTKRHLVGSVSSLTGDYYFAEGFVDVSGENEPKNIVLEKLVFSKVQRDFIENTRFTVQSKYYLHTKMSDNSMMVDLGLKLVTDICLIEDFHFQK